MCKSSTLTISGTAMLSVTNITPSSSVAPGATVNIIATVTNSGSAPGSAVVNFYADGTLVSTQGTSMIAPGASQDVGISINTASWSIGAHNISAKTSTESGTC